VEGIGVVRCAKGAHNKNRQFCPFGAPRAAWNVLLDTLEVLQVLQILAEERQRVHIDAVDVRSTLIPNLVCSRHDLLAGGLFGPPRGVPNRSIRKKSRSLHGQPWSRSLY
jgi:hypothetical protein